MRLRLIAVLFALAAPALAAPALAAAPAERAATLTALAETLGQSHALRQACAGPGDQYWRARMMRLIEVEKPEQALEARLTEAFNAGYAQRRSLFRACSPAARRAEAQSAARGRNLAAQLSRVYRPARRESEEAAPDAMAPETRPR
jgi:uncharacterized protein (TIGR02301 family)